jgi:site-specific DNA-methyltransferase (adenine-specific)
VSDLVVLTGDCLTVLPKIEASCADLILTDLPYGTTRCKWDTPVDLDQLWPHLWRVLKPDGILALFATQPFTSRLISRAWDDFRYIWVWEKTKATGHLNAKKQPLRAHEDIVIFYRKPGTYNPQFTEGKPYKGSSRPASSGTAHYSSYGAAREDNPGVRYPRSVLKYGYTKGKKGSKHDTEKPVDLLRYFVRTYTNPGELVLDVTAGSGSTGEAALREDRRFVGIELDPPTAASSRERLGAL